MTHFDLVIIGTGSGNSVIGPEFDDWSIAVVEDGKFGGTCLNVGCIPTKMYVHPAELADAGRHSARLGVTQRLEAVDWPGMRDRIFGRIDAIETGGRAYRAGDECPNVTVFAGRGTFTGHKRLRVDLHDGSTAEITADRWVIAAGSRAVIPDIPGLSDGSAPFHTSDTVMRIDDLPRSVVIIGGGYIAAEFGHVFSSFGTEVTQITRSPQLLRSHDEDVSAAFTAAASARYRVLAGANPSSVKALGEGGVSLVVDTEDGPVTVEAELLLVATGRVPNGDRLAVDRTGVDLDESGRVVVDAHQRTTVDGIWALGDVCSPWALKHVANHEARVVKHNLAHPEAPVAADHRFVPAAVFTDPQIASVGWTERELVARGIPYVAKKQWYADIAAGWAREDTHNFLKVLADPATGHLLGAHVIGPEAATVIQPLIQGMHFGQTAHEIARGQYWIHPALPELVENALLGLPAPTGPAAATA
ncbi:mycothione reductase [Nakamurella endophytica]|uniref:Mycothione reductase n=1 Tax=Nakamurella endophytica TaxID=1748367 RepID=A0A917WDL8_9ACTN|nr:mycothione reductase [Nakamurella endophytica]GGL95575.1 mycothione reductase [Nakamurella endophytica]